MFTGELEIWVVDWAESYREIVPCVSEKAFAPRMTRVKNGTN